MEYICCESSLWEEKSSNCHTWARHPPSGGKSFPLHTELRAFSKNRTFPQSPSESPHYFKCWIWGQESGFTQSFMCTCSASITSFSFFFFLEGSNETTHRVEDVTLPIVNAESSNFTQHRVSIQGIVQSRHAVPGINFCCCNNLN